MRVPGFPYATLLKHEITDAQFKGILPGTADTLVQSREPHASDLGAPPTAHTQERHTASLASYLYDYGQPNHLNNVFTDQLFGEDAHLLQNEVIHFQL
jgi:hypothetical protein